MSEERRRAERRAECVVFRVDMGDQHDRVAVTRNRSTTGILFATPSRLKVGDHLALTRLDPNGTVVEAHQATVVRVESGQSRSGPMRFLVAVQLEGGP
jgi:hypothetical protein